MNIIDELNDFINQTKESKEIKRALAVKMTLSGKSYHEVKELLNVSHSFISEWKNQALFHGVESLRLQYQGRQGYLKTVEKEKTIEWLRAQDYLRLSDLKKYLSNIQFPKTFSVWNFVATYVGIAIYSYLRQSLIVLSLLPLAILLPSGLKQTV